MNRTLVVTTLVFVALAGNAAPAPPKSAPKGAAKTPAPPPPPAIQLFDPAASKLSPGFTGSDFRAVYHQLAIAPKGEFETTEQYEARRRAIAEKIFAFRVPEPLVTYDADKGEFSIDVNHEAYSAGASDVHGRSMIVLAESEMETGRYTGSNAFGVKRVVRKVTRRKWGVSIPHENFEQTVLKLPATPDQARAIKSHLGVIAVCKVGPNSVPERDAATDATGYDVIGATVDLPTDLTIFYYVIDAQVLGYWVYDTRTGDVYGRYDEIAHTQTAAASAAAATFPAEALPVDMSPFAIVSKLTSGMPKAEAEKLLARFSKSVTEANGREVWNLGEVGIVVTFQDGKVVSSEFHDVP